MASARQTAITQSTITVETEYETSLELEIIAESSGIYAVNYEEDGVLKAGQYNQSLGELYESSSDDCFRGYDSEYQAQTVSNDGSLRWVDVTED